MAFNKPQRIEALREVAASQGVPLAEMRGRLFTAGNRVNWIDADGRRVFLCDEVDERHATIESIEWRDGAIWVSGYVSTLHAADNVRVVVSSENSANVECEVVERPDLAIAGTKDDGGGSEPFVPVGFSGRLPRERVQFWMDAGGATSPQFLDFAEGAPLTNEDKSYATIGGMVITCPGKRRDLAMMPATPVGRTKRAVAWKIHELSH